jgi:5-methyltetrahydrofolate--homocysteine methyltransferase
MSDTKVLIEAIIKGDVNKAVAETQKALDENMSVRDIIDNQLIAAMDQVGENFSKGLIFVPQMLRSAKTMQECMKLLEPFFHEEKVTSKGKILIGTVKGDLHDIGKNLVSMMLEGAGFQIIDLGIDVSPEKFVQNINEHNPEIIAMSALLSTTMPSMPRTIEAIEKAGLRNQVKVLIGGAPVTEKFAQEIKADGYAPDAASSVTKAKKLLGIS